MSETNTVTRSTAPHMIQEPSLHQGNPQHQKNKKKHQSSQQTSMPTQPHGQEEQ